MDIVVPLFSELTPLIWWTAEVCSSKTGWQVPPGVTGPTIRSRLWGPLMLGKVSRRKVIWVWINTYYCNTIFRGMNIHLPAILMFTRGTRFWHTAIYIYWSKMSSCISQLQWQVELTTLASFCWGKTATRQIMMTELHKHLLPWKRVTAQGYCSLKSRVMKVVGAHVFDFYNAVSAWYAYLFGSWHLVTSKARLWTLSRYGSKWSTPPALVRSILKLTNLLSPKWCTSFLTHTKICVKRLIHFQ